MPSKQFESDGREGRRYDGRECRQDAVPDVRHGLIPLHRVQTSVDVLVPGFEHLAKFGLPLLQPVKAAVGLSHDVIQHFFVSHGRPLSGRGLDAYGFSTMMVKRPDDGSLAATRALLMNRTVTLSGELTQPQKLPVSGTLPF